MCRNTLPIATVVLAFFLQSAAESQAALLLNATGGGTASVAYEGSTLYMHPPTFIMPLDGTIVTVNFTSPSDIAFDSATFGASDDDFNGGFRLSERITNSSGSSWLGFDLVLSETTGTFFTDLPIFSPTFAEINMGMAIQGSGPNVVVKDDAPIGSLTLSGDRKSIHIVFDTPLPTGSFFDIHVPIEGLPDGGGSFVLTQTPIEVNPEPASLATWCGIMGLGLLYGRRKSSFVKPASADF